ncbi:MAG: hypothetical protein M3R51_09425 [Candidatus Eremiobacteraeota bacterium]|nr:hypothetical protein [Candidatus Eremiobacteraeota bacterium]
MRQARAFGTVWALAALAAFLWPLLLSFVVTSIQATIWMYVFAMALDVVLFIAWLAAAIRYSQRSARGELFEVQWLARMTGKPPQKR